MVLAVAIVSGFKQEIRDKLTGFNAHIQISHFDRNFSYESSPFRTDTSSDRELRALPEVSHVQHFATKAGILKKGTTLLGVVAKGVGSDYDWTFFRNHLKEGSVFSSSGEKPSNEVMISESVAKTLDVKVGDSLAMYFIQQPPRVRKFRISGIYSTGFEEFDKLYLFCDIGQIRKLNEWQGDEVGGTELYVHDIERLDEVTEKVYAGIGSDLNARSIREIYPQIFDWLKLQDINAMIIIVLMVIVSGINMVSALLVILLERVNMIGTMKALGTTDGQLRKVFLWISGYIVGRGIVIGNLIGIGLALLQQYLHFLPLDQSSYYIDHVPILLDPFTLMLLTAGTLFTCVGILVVPTLLIGKIRPVNALRFS